MTLPSYDALVLAGGRGRRLGGVSKPDVVVGGRRLIAHVLGAVEGPGVRRVVVVGPDTLALPAGVTRTLEEPPDGGPVAGIAAGLVALRDGSEPEWVLVLACDVPRVAGAVPRLVAAANLGGTDGSAPARDGVVLVDDDGRDQPLVGLYRRAALDAAVARLGAGGGASGVRGASVRALVAALDLTRLTDPEHQGVDVDTWDDVVGLDRSDRATTPGATATATTAGTAPTRGTMARQLDAPPDVMPEAVPDGRRTVTQPEFDTDSGPVRPDTPASALETWAQVLAAELGVGPDVLDVAAVLDAAAAAAGRVGRPAGPVTSFLIGYAAAQGPVASRPAALRDAFERTTVLADHWQDRFARLDGQA